MKSLLFVTLLLALEWRYSASASHACSRRRFFYPHAMQIWSGIQASVLAMPLRAALVMGRDLRTLVRLNDTGAHPHRPI